MNESKIVAGLAALAHEHRLRIFRLLVKRDSRLSGLLTDVGSACVAGCWAMAEVETANGNRQSRAIFEGCMSAVLFDMVDPRRVELLTSSLRTTRSTS